MNAELSISGRIAILAIQLGVIIFAAKLCGRLAQKLRIPPVLGELLAGILIGPYLLGGLNMGVPGFAEGLFPMASGSALPVSLPLYAIATLGSIMLLFMSGLETDLRMLFRYSVTGTVVGVGGVVFSFVFGAGLGMVLLHTGVFDPRCLFLGILCTATSVGITARILSEKKSIDSPEGTTILAAAVIDDVLGIICLAVVMGIVGSSGAVDWTSIEKIAFRSIVIWLGVTAAGLLLAHRIAGILKKFTPGAAYAIPAFGLALLLAGLFEQAGLAMIVGAYVMGLSLSKTDISFSVQQALRGIYDLLVPVFFVVMGMLVDVRVLTDPEVLKFGLLYSLLAVLGKVLGCALPAYCMNFNALGALRIGAGMIPRGEVALIIAGIGATTMMRVNGHTVPVIDSRLFGVAILMTLATTLLAPPLLAAMLAIKGKGVRRETGGGDRIHTVYTFPTEVTADFVLRLLIGNFRNEGFRNSEIDREGGLTHFRRESTMFSLEVIGTRFDFETAPSEVALIRTVVYETVIELHRQIAQLKLLTAPEAFESAVLAGLETKPRLRGGNVNPDKLIPPGCVITDLRAASHTEAITRLIERLGREHRIADPDRCKADVLEREELVSTCASEGVAFPHARTLGADRLVAAVGICRDGYREFPDAGPTIRIVVLSLCPPESDKPYLQFVAHMAAKLHEPENFRKLIACKSEEEFRATLSTEK